MFPVHFIRAALNPNQPGIENPPSRLEDNELLFVPRIDGAESVPSAAVAVAASDLHPLLPLAYISLPVSVTPDARTPPLDLSTARKSSGCNDCNEVRPTDRPESGNRRRIDGFLLQVGGCV